MHMTHFVSIRLFIVVHFLHFGLGFPSHTVFTIFDVEGLAFDDEGIELCLVGPIVTRQKGVAILTTFLLPTHLLNGKPPT